MPEMSIVIPTYGRPASLRRLLFSLVEAIGSEDVEVLVVDNHPQRTAERTVQKCPQELSSLVRYIHTSPSGVSHARNVGVKSSAAEKIVLVDDDIEMPPGALKELRKTWENHPNAIVTPRILINDDEAPNWLTTRLKTGVASFDLGERTMCWQRGLKWPIGAVLCFRRSVFEMLGGFPSHLDRKGERAVLGGGDTVFVRKAFEHGVQIWYQGNVTVVHHVFDTDDRRQQEYWFRHAVGGGYSAVLVAEHFGERIGAEELVKWSIYAVVHWVISITSRGLRRFEHRYKSNIYWGRLKAAARCELP